MWKTEEMDKIKLVGDIFRGLDDSDLGLSEVKRRVEDSVLNNWVEMGVIC